MVIPFDYIIVPKFYDPYLQQLSAFIFDKLLNELSNNKLGLAGGIKVKIKSVWAST